MAASDLSKRSARWLRDPVSFITEVLLRDPETGQPFALYPAQVEFFAPCVHAFPRRPFGLPRADF
jgi:hypothetical protein